MIWLDNNNKKNRIRNPHNEVQTKVDFKVTGNTLYNSNLKKKYYNVPKRNNNSYHKTATKKNTVSGTYRPSLYFQASQMFILLLSLGY